MKRMRTSRPRSSPVVPFGPTVEERTGSLAQLERRLQEEISARKAAEACAEHDRAALRQMAERMTDAFVMLDRDWRFIQVNERAARLLGRSAEELLGQRVLEAFPEGAGAMCHNEFVRAARENRVVSFEQYFEPWNRWFHCTVCPSADTLSAYFRDTTEWKEREQELAASKARLSFLLSATPAVIYTAAVSASGGMTTFISENVTAQTGWSAADFLNDPRFWIDHIHPADAAAVLEMRNVLLRDSREVIGEYRFQFADGSYHWMLDAARARPNGDGSVEIAGYWLDISEQKSIQSALRDNDERLRLALEAARIGTFDWDALSNRGVWSPRQEELWGYAPGEFDGTFEAFTSRIHPDDRARVLAAKESTAEDFTNEFRVVWPDGSVHWIEVRGKSVRDASQRPLSRRGVVVETTAQKQADLAVRESEERVRLALDAARMGSFDWELSSNRVTWSRRQEELFGYAPGEFPGTYDGFARRVHPEDLPAMEAEMQRHLETGESFTHEYRVVWPDGSIHWIIGRGEFSFDEAKRPVRMRGVAVDVTDRKTLQDSLRESEQRLRSILDGLGPGILAGLLDVEGRILFVNRPALAVSGPALEKIEGKLAWEVGEFGDSEEVRTRLREAVKRSARGESVRYDERITLAGGESAWLQFSIEPVRNDKGAVIFLVPAAVVITDRKRVERKLEESGRQLRALLARFETMREDERVRISRELHDELGQVLTSLKLDIRWLERTLTMAQGAFGFGVIVDRIVEASVLVDAAIASVQRIVSEFRSGALDRLPLPDALTAEARRFEERSGVRCWVHAVGEGTRVPRQAAQELFAIAQEALTNVVRHARATQVTMWIAVESDSVVLVVADNGVGFPEEALDAPSSLGLIGMRERASLHAGQVSLQRNDFGGTTVTARMPL